MGGVHSSYSMGDSGLSADVTKCGAQLLLITGMDCWGSLLRELKATEGGGGEVLTCWVGQTEEAVSFSLTSWARYRWSGWSRTARPSDSSVAVCAMESATMPERSLHVTSLVEAVTSRQVILLE